MASIAPPQALPPDAQSAPDLRASLSVASQEASAATKAADALLDQAIAALRNEIIPDKLLVRLDEDAGRFVQTLTDANTDETVLRYPNDAQLAYSRAVMAYVRALAIG